MTRPEQMSTYRWGGHEFSVHDYNTTTDWPDVSGVYVFARRVWIGLGLAQGNPMGWKSLYVGETESFKNRPLANHEKWPAAVKLGATHIHIRDEGMVGRKALEVHLKQKYDPRLNRK